MILNSNAVNQYLRGGRGLYRGWSLGVAHHPDQLFELHDCSHTCHKEGTILFYRIQVARMPRLIQQGRREV